VKDEEVRFKQILAAQWTGATNGVQSYSMLGLSEDGRVFRYDPLCEGWIPWSMKIAGCKDSHKGRR
jgi:hypothetical protein